MSTAQAPILLDVIESPLGPIQIAATAQGVCSIHFGRLSSTRAEYTVLAQMFGGPIASGRNAHIDLCAYELAQYFDAQRTTFSVPVALAGTPFQQAVWTALRAIDYGETTSYAELALRIGRPRGQRAVGHANGQNRIPIIIPCHRVIERNGGLGGYNGQRWRKNFLLNLERNTVKRGQQTLLFGSSADPNPAVSPAALAALAAE
ncbi:MAG: methylated-DNA--[protein]-cysteine S-methyltransferase [Deltaproteobacteria bacterium]|nr:methylated-DNA--[protein]-cysteine S-methyltransferase [Deltaproteobacteria bacterium]